MLATLGIIVVMGCIAVLEIPLILKKKWKKELWTFIILMILAAGFASALAIGIHLPNPWDYIAMVFKPFSDLIIRVLS